MKVIFCILRFGQWDHIRELVDVPIPRIGEYVRIRGSFEGGTHRDFHDRVSDVCYDYDNESVEVMIGD